MRSFWLRLKMLRYCLMVIKDPRRTDELLLISNQMVLPENFVLIFEHINRDPNMKHMLDQMTPVHWPSLQELEAFPEGTVGKAYADHMISKNLDPYFYLLATEHKISPKIDYFRQRVFQSHDLWHVLTGFTTEVDDEAALQAFTLAQVRGPFSALVVCLAILHFVRYRVVDLMKVVDKVVWGWYLGKTSRLLLSVPFEQIMRRPLKEVQAEYLPALSRKTEYAQQAALQL